MPRKKQAQKKKLGKQLFENLMKTTREFFRSRSFVPQTRSALIERLHIQDFHLHIFDEVLNALKQEGFLKREGKKYQLGKNEQVVRGTIYVHPRGFGFVDQPSPQVDVFIPKSKMNGAVDGDVVDIAITGDNFGKGPEGTVIGVVERKHQRLIGTVRKCYKNQVEVYCSLLGELHPIICPHPDGQVLCIGDRVIIDVVSWGSKKEPTSCKVSKILGSMNDPSIDLPFVIAEHNLLEKFPDEAVDEARQFGAKMLPSNLVGRRDLCDLECVTIDPDTAKDFDDAISLESIGDVYRLGVHIADVSHYVRSGSHLDRAAFERCNSTYLCQAVLPMLPPALSENLCSLRPHVPRLAVSIFTDIDASGEVLQSEVVRSVIMSKARLTYGEAREILQMKKSSDFFPLLDRLKNLCLLLKRRRHERGCVQLYLPEYIVRLDERGDPIQLVVEEYDVVHQMVEECMLKANELVAIQIAKKGKDLSYRVHEEPSAESLMDFATLVASFGFSLPNAPTPQDIQKFFLEIEGTEHEAYLAACYIRSMRLACYSVDNIGHYGLSLEHYCHFTSPIRRYVDLVIHRLLLEDDPIDRRHLDEICASASTKERLSARAEGEIRTLKKLRLLQKHRQEDPKKEFSAMITAVKPHGVFFDVHGCMVEGFLHVSELTDDFFIFDDLHNCLVGERRGHCYKCGDFLRLRCLAVDLITQTANWRLVNGRKISNDPSSRIISQKR